MSFQQLHDDPNVVLLQRSLERGRLGHAYLFEGDRLDALETVARTLAKTLNCRDPRRSTDNRASVDCCDRCPPCRQSEEDTHPDVHWLRPASKSRVITAEQMRTLLGEIHLKPSAGAHKVAIIAGADRLNSSAANIFLKTLEEPPSRSVMLLLSTEPQRLLDTILSRCLRLRLGTQQPARLSADELAWLEGFAQTAAGGETSLMSRYRLLSTLLVHLSEQRKIIEDQLAEQSPLERYDEVDKALRDKWESELSAATESEYRRRRTELLCLVQLWLRDVWLQTMGVDPSLDALPAWPATACVARRTSAVQALANLDIIEQAQRLLHTNVQEALALEVCLLKLQL